MRPADSLALERVGGRVLSAGGDEADAVALVREDAERPPSSVFAGVPCGGERQHPGLRGGAAWLIELVHAVAVRVRVGRNRIGSWRGRSRVTERRLPRVVGHCCARRVRGADILVTASTGKKGGSASGTHTWDDFAGTVTVSVTASGTQSFNTAVRGVIEDSSGTNRISIRQDEVPVTSSTVTISVNGTTCFSGSFGTDPATGGGSIFVAEQKITTTAS